MAEQVEITVKVNGEIVPLSTISTETFEKIKKENKPKKVPVARIGNYPDEPKDKRLILRLPKNIHIFEGKVVAIDLDSGVVYGNWNLDEDDSYGANSYENVRVIE